MTVTSLRPDLQRPSYVIVSVDGVRYASLPAELVRELALRSGASLSDEERRALDRAAKNEAAFRAAQGTLARRPRARRDLERRLVQRGHDGVAVQSAADRLAALGALDDSRFAEHFASVRAGKGHGRSRLLRDLLHAGVERGMAEKAVDAALVDAGDPLERLRPQMTRRAAGLARLPRATRRRRLLAFLARRGH